MATIPAASAAPSLVLGDELPQALYRLFAEEGALLYVGITDSLKVRFAKHAVEKRRWPQVARKTAEWYPTQREAADAERTAIRLERPLYNIAGASYLGPRRTTGAAFAPPGDLAERGALEDRARELLTADIGHAECVLRLAALTMCDDRLPRGTNLRRLADSCGVSHATAFAVLRQQDEVDALILGSAA